jgi:hypothetical protein
MLDLKLTEIFSVLGVGIFVVISIVYFYFLLQRLFNIRRHNKDAFFIWLKNTLNANYKDTGYAIVIGLVIYSAGMLTQDLTDHMTDSERNFNPLISFVKSVELLETEGDLRRAVLIENPEKLTGLGSEVFGNARKIFGMDATKPPLEFFDDGTEAKCFWKVHGAEISRDIDRNSSLNKLVNGLYYTSKNWCFLRSDPIRNELSDIQERIDFSRSICIIAFIDILVILLFYAAYYLNEFFFKKSRSRFKVVSLDQTTKAGEPPVFKRKVHKRIFNPLRCIFILTLIIYASRICYSAAEKNFNERAMGYYTSELKFAKK